MEAMGHPTPQAWAAVRVWGIGFRVIGLGFLVFEGLGFTA